jgi:hypothetical protein
MDIRNVVPGIRFVGSLIKLETVLALRYIDIDQFIGLHNAVHIRANANQLWIALR